MKIGICFSPNGRSYGRYGKDKFLKIRQHGYNAVDYNISDTSDGLYNLNEGDLALNKMFRELILSNQNNNV